MCAMYQGRQVTSDSTDCIVILSLLQPIANECLIQNHEKSSSFTTLSVH